MIFASGCASANPATLREIIHFSGIMTLTVYDDNTSSSHFDAVINLQGSNSSMVETIGTCKTFTAMYKKNFGAIQNYMEYLRRFNYSVSERF